MESRRSGMVRVALGSLRLESPRLHVPTHRFGPGHGLLAMVEAVPDPEVVWRLHDLGLDSPAAPIDEFRAKELSVRVELEKKLTRWSLRRGLGWREGDTHVGILAHVPRPM